MVKKCSVCQGRAALKRPKNGDMLCKECFTRVFETEVRAEGVQEGVIEFSLSLID